MIDFTDPIIKKFIESLHRVVEHKSQKIASKPYDEYVLENRILKLFCADKMITPDECAEKINDLYNIMLYTKYPVLDGGRDCKAIEKFGNVYMKHFLYDASDFLRSICHNDEVFQPGMTVEEFLINDPDAQSMLIAPRNSI